MKLDISKIPFSRYGSYFAVNYFPDRKKLYLRNIQGGDESPSELFEIKVLDSSDNELDLQGNFEFDVTETKLSLKGDSGEFELIFPEADTCHIRVNGLKVRLVADKVRYDTFIKLSSERFEYISYKKEARFGLQLKNANYLIDAPWVSVGNEYVHIDLWDNELFIDHYKLAHDNKKPSSFDEEEKSLEEEYKNWHNSLHKVPEKYQASYDMATYLLWANSVGEEGLVTEEVTYMSKNWMQNIWSWDNCFNAIALAKSHPELSYNQLKIFMDYQDEKGAYPDYINDKFVSYSCLKPPIHAWAYKKMIEENPVFLEEKYLKPVYESLVKATAYWLNYRVTEEGLFYYTHGNDSGWDNASIYQQGLPVSSPDLVAYIVQQLDVLAEFAETLNKPYEARRHKETADYYFSQLMDKYFNGEQFVALDALTGEVIKQQTSAILYLPLVVAYRMDKSTVEVVRNRLIERFEGEYGLATEEISSPYYKGDGYWLGPIWAPQTYILADALNRAGYKEDYLRLARKYADVTLVGGMAENHNPITGEGNDDLAFAWTSSVFLLLARDLK